MAVFIPGVNSRRRKNPAQIGFITKPPQILIATCRLAWQIRILRNSGIFNREIQEPTQ